MINIPNRITPPLCKETLDSLNAKVTQPINKDTVNHLNRNTTNPNSMNNAQRSQLAPVDSSSRTIQSRNVQQVTRSTQTSQPVVNTTVSAVNIIPDMPVPALVNQLRKGQKTVIDPQGKGISRLRACFGWNVKDSRCDIDASAFMVTDNGKVPDESWFVFYSQADSPDGSVNFAHDSGNKDREVISVDLSRLNPSIKKIIFVMTINEAFENNLNFSMIKDAYVRLMDGNTNQEIVSYKIEEYYPNVTSMTIGELYLHNGQWKFNPVGNGVHQDLAGQCAIYGVEIC